MLDARCWHPQRGLPVDDPRWREPVVDVALNADGENGPAARSFAADAHDCIMVRIQTDLPHTSVAARSCAPMASSPRINTPDKRCPTPQLKKPVSGHHPSACSGVKALRNTSDAKRQAAKLR